MSLVIDIKLKVKFGIQRTSVKKKKREKRVLPENEAVTVEPFGWLTYMDFMDLIM